MLLKLETVKSDLFVFILILLLYLKKNYIIILIDKDKIKFFYFFILKILKKLWIIEVCFNMFELFIVKIMLRKDNGIILIFKSLFV